MSANLKSVPVADLSLVAIIYAADFHENEETGATIADYEYEIYDQAAFDRTSIPKRTRCDCCGHSLKYSCLVQHTPTQQVFFIGRDCARTIESLSKLETKIENASVALLQKAKCNAREEAFYAANPTDGHAMMAWAKSGINRTADDIAGKLRSYGLSEKQVAFLRSLWARDIANRSVATGVAPTGRQTISGVVLSVKVVTVPGFSRYASSQEITKVLVDLGNGAKVYGNAPSAVEPVKGDKVQFTATFEPSERDNLFGFWKRPTKWVKL